MPTNTYVALSTHTITSAVSSYTFTSIEQGYTDLVLVIGGAASSAQGMFLYFNNDTGSNYSRTFVYGDGSSALSDRSANGKVLEIGSAISTVTANIMNYSNTTTFKTTITRGGSASNLALAEVGLWRSTSAINRIDVVTGTGTINVGTTISLYGIGGVGGDSTVQALGGIVTEDATYYYHTFKGAGTFEPLQSLSADILVVAGGGGGAHAGGGGGGGGLLGFASQSLTAQRYPVLVGAGGAGSRNLTNPTSGNNSLFGTLTAALGGGYGAGYVGGVNYFSAAVGGSGGGGAFNAVGQFANGTAGQGNAGNNGYQADGGGSPRSGGGGGGAGGAATNGGVANTGGNGGVGATNGSTVGGSAGPYSFINAMGAASGTGQLSGGNYYYAGGGGGDGKNTRGYGGLGGGGNGGTEEPQTLATAGTAFTGGGAGSTGGTYIGFNGGSGVVIVRYAK